MLIVKGNIIAREINGISENTPPPLIVAFGNLNNYNIQNAIIIDGDLITNNIICSKGIIATGDIVIIGETRNDSKF